MAEGGAYRTALRHRDFRLMIGSFAISAIGSWAYNIALWVWIYDKTGSAAWVAASSLSRFLPALVLSAYGGVLAERFERTRVMRYGDATMAVTMALLAVTAALDGPVTLAIVFAAMTTSAGMANDPAVQAMVPQVVGEKDLAAANALYGTIDNLAVIAGPALGAGLLLIASPALSFAVNALTFVVSVVMVGRMTARSTPTDVTDGGEAGMLAQVLVGVDAIRSSMVATALVGFLVLSYLAYGADTVLFVVLTDERFGASTNGVGYLLMGAGIGGILVAGVVNRLAALPRLGLVILVGLSLYFLPTALLVVVDDFRIAVALQVVRGMGMLGVDVLAITALQRSLAPELLSRVFGVFGSFALGAVALGAFVVPLLLDVASLDTTLLVFGLGLPLLAATSWPWVRRMDRVAVQRLAELAPRIEVLEVLGIFAAAPRPVLERLAAAADEVTADTGTAIIEQGEPADALYIIASGEVVVEAHGGPGADGADGEVRHLATLRGPAYFGEIGLLERIPRTATVRALEPCRMWRIDGEAFLDALNEAPAAHTFLETARTRRTRARPVPTPATDAATSPAGPTGELPPAPVV